MTGHKNEQVEVVFGTGFIVKLERDFTLPVNFSFNVKKGSTAIEKIKSSKKYY